MKMGQIPACGDIYLRVCPQHRRFIGQTRVAVSLLFSLIGIFDASSFEVSYGTIQSTDSWLRQCPADFTAFPILPGRRA